MSFMTGLYDGAAGFGQIQAWIGLVVCAVIAIVLIVVAVYMYKKNGSRADNVVPATATVKSSNCQMMDKSNRYLCDVSMDLAVTGPCPSGTRTGCSIDKQAWLELAHQPKTGELLQVEYDQRTVSDMKGYVGNRGSSQTNHLMIVYALPSIASCILLIAIGNLLLVQNSKFYAAGSGVAGIVHMFK